MLGFNVVSYLENDVLSPLFYPFGFNLNSCLFPVGECAIFAPQYDENDKKKENLTRCRECGNH